MRVILATDGSSSAEVAAGFLSRLPHKKPLDLTVLSVNYLPEIHGTIEVVDLLERNNEEALARAQEACQRIKHMFQGADARVETVVVEGHSGEMIVQEAKERGADLVIVGAVGHSTFERIMLGSVGDFVATHADCSVLVVRPSILDELKKHPLKICVAYDDSEPCQTAIRGLNEFQWSQETQIDLVTTIAMPYMYSDIPIPIDTSAAQDAALKKLAHGAKLCSSLSSNIVSHVREASHYGDGIVRFAEEKQSDLIVLGDTGRGLMGRFLMGSVSRYVLRHAPCSVWIGR